MSINPDISNKETDLYPITSQRIKKLNETIGEKLRPWEEYYMRKNELEVVNYHGRTISYSGILLSGSPMLVFWDNFIEPFLENGAMEILKGTYQLCNEKGLSPQIYMKESSKLLKLLNQETYERMSKLCSKSKNKGFPQGETPVNVKGRINDMNRFTDSYTKATLIRRVESDDTIPDKIEKLASKNISPFPTPNHAKWSDIKITVVDDNHVDIKAKGITKNKIHFSKMGFEYRKTGRKTKLWRTLRTFALNEGSIPPKVDRQGKLV